MTPPIADSLYLQLEQILASRIDPQRIITQEAKRLAYGTDASFYRLIPKIVLRLKSLDEVIFAIQSCGQLGIHFTFRAAGTSLSGQAVSDSVLITLTDDWRGHEVQNQGLKIRLQPGVIGADANKYLAPFQRKIGPIPPPSTPVKSAVLPRITPAACAAVRRKTLIAPSMVCKLYLPTGMCSIHATLTVWLVLNKSVPTWWKAFTRCAKRPLPILNSPSAFATNTA